MITTSCRADEPLLAAFHAGVYLDAFAAQREPLEAWQRALRGEAPYELTVRVVRDGGPDQVGAGRIAGGIAYELYPRSRCGLVTYMVVAPAFRRHGLGKELQASAVDELFARGARAVFGEIDDPQVHGEVAAQRLARNRRWGARVVDTRYVQPALGPGLARDRELILIALAGRQPLPDTMPGEVVESFVRELYACTEGGDPDPEVRVPAIVTLATEWPRPRA
jgi:GNAT superfamily N-acetyltransferase